MKYENLKRLLRDRGIQQKYLYDQLGVTPATFIYKREHGTFTRDEILKILEVLNDNTKHPTVDFKDL